jgi:hypothetical protein
LVGHFSNFFNAPNFADSGTLLDRIFELPHVVKIVTILAILKKIGDK